MRQFLLFALLLAPAGLTAEARASGHGHSTLRREIGDAVLLVRAERAKGRKQSLILLGVLKSHPALGDRKEFVLEREDPIPVPDPKKPPKFVLFADHDRGKWEFYRGYKATPEMVAYVRGLVAIDRKSPRQVLRHCLDHLDSADEHVAQDALGEFGAAAYKDVAAVARTLPRNRWRRLVADAKASRLARDVGGFLLAHCAAPEDAELIRKLAEPREGKDGFMHEYAITANLVFESKAGWEHLRRTLTDGQRDFNTRCACLRAARFARAELAGAIPLKEITDALSAALDQPDMADFIIEDLRKWKQWQHTDRVLSLYNRKGYEPGVLQRAILRYALQSPLPQAEQFIARQRKADPERVADVEEMLKLEAEP